MAKAILGGRLAGHSTPWLFVVPIAIGAVLANQFASTLVVDLYTFFCVTLMLVLGLQMFMGNSGILNWSYVGYMGVGAFASSILSVAPSVKALGVPNMYPFLVELQTSIPVALLIGGVVAAILAAIIAWPLMRLSDAVGVITLFATLIVFHVVMTQWDNVTNGPRTFFGVPSFTTIWIAAGAAIVTLLAVYYFRQSSLGLRLRASRDDRYAAMAIGVNIVAVRYFTYVLSAFVAGLGGGLWAHYITSFSPTTSFYVTEVFVLLTMLVIGGEGSVSGAVVGTAIITVLREVLRQVESLINNSGSFSLDVYGLTQVSLAILMIVILIWRPTGIIGGQELTWPLFKKKRSAESAVGVEQP